MSKHKDNPRPTAYSKREQCICGCDGAVEGDPPACRNVREWLGRDALGVKAKAALRHMAAEGGISSEDAFPVLELMGYFEWLAKGGKR